MQRRLLDALLRATVTYTLEIVNVQASQGRFLVHDYTPILPHLNLSVIMAEHTLVLMSEQISGAPAKRGACLPLSHTVMVRAGLLET